MTHNPKLSVLANPSKTVIECSCGNFTAAKSGRGRPAEEELLHLHSQHVKEQR